MSSVQQTWGLWRLRQIAFAVILIVLLLSPFAESPIGYFFATFPICLCIVIWLQRADGGIPALPIVSALYWIYYALPLLRTPSRKFLETDYGDAGLSVGIFFACATFCWWLIVRIPKRSRGTTLEEAAVSERQIFPIVCLGLFCGLTYGFASVLGELTALGTFVGVVRSVAVTCATIASFLLGYGRGKRWLTGGRWLFVAALYVVYVLLNMFSLYISTAAALILGTVIAYALASKRVPIVALVALLGLFTVLHAGKGDMRGHYWNSGGAEGAEISDAPAFFTEWIETGVTNLTTGKASGDAALERTSLLQMLILVQYMSPRLVPHLEGATYAYLGTTLVPRFLDPDKVNSQSGLNLMSVHYGLQRVEDTKSTTVAWGLIAEAYANFGTAGVAMAGLVFGLLNGFVTRLSIGNSPLSLPYLLAATATLNILNVEADFSYLMLNILQSVVSVSIFASVLRFFKTKRKFAGRPEAQIGDPLQRASARIGLRRNARPDF